MRAPLIIFLILISGLSYADKSCGPCIHKKRECRVMNGSILISTFAEPCAEAPTIAELCTPCVFQSTLQKEVFADKAVRLGEPQRKWIRYSVKSTSEEQKFWCDEKTQKCENVMNLCEQRRVENPACNGDVKVKDNTPIKPAR